MADPQAPEVVETDGEEEIELSELDEVSGGAAPQNQEAQ
jgi:hypothetical protein